MRKSVYPFTAIVGQNEMKKALILNVINPKIGGLLIRGQKGTAKSTAVRALVDLLPALNTVKDCVFRCDPYSEDSLCKNCLNKIKNNEKIDIVKTKMRVVELPVSATEDRVVGTIDIEHALKNGEKRFEPGILADANRNILYIDEVNLLEDHVVDILLDSAAMGVNTIEREGVSYSHPSRFVLVGTMNPEEGDIRPQLIDRFGLCVDVKAEEDINNRIDVIKRRLEYESSPEQFAEKYKNMQDDLSKRIINAKSLLNKINFNEDVLRLTAVVCSKLEVDGHRADITMIKTAVTIAAFEGRKVVNLDDVKEAAKLVLPHRMRRKPFEEGKIEWNALDKMVETCKEELQL